ncbi:MAG: rhamnogalacturonan acetylesterase [Bacteroidales bacterium]|jgi:lysophospholipase L1-like esterase|nr:rhamnogalacturonan acetylesterase [Bacteroidales bacterium]
MTIHPKSLLTILFATASSLMTAQTFDVDFSKKQPAYNGTMGYDFNTTELNKKNLKQMSYSFAVPDGNYRVTITLGSNAYAGKTIVRAESRRILTEQIDTKKKEFKTLSWTIHKRSPQINAEERVKTKPREKDYLNWDDRLTLTFNGDAPAVKSIHIEPDTTAVTLFLCGNSTVVDQENEPWASWGQPIVRWFDENVCIANYAESGERTTSFMASKRLDKALSMAKAGDYFLIEFGHNDEKDRGAGSGAWYNFSHNLKTFIDRIKAKGCTPILITPTARRFFEGNNLKDTHGEYPAATRAVAQREGIGLIDLTEMTMTLFSACGPEGSKHLLVHYPANSFPGQETALADNTHFNVFGAYEVAKCIIMGLKKIEAPFIKYLRSDWQDFDPAKPDNWESFKLMPADNAEIEKPDGN